MALRKIIIVTAVLATLLYACVDPHQKPAVNLGVQMDQQKDLIMEQMTHDLLFQDSILRLINMELENIDALYISFEGNVERNAATPSQALSVIARIRSLNETMTGMRNDLNNIAVENKGLVEMIDRIQKELMAKEKRIVELQETVARQEEELAQQERLITGLKTSNARQQQDLQRLENDIRSMKALAYTDLADLLLQIAEEMPEIKGLFTRRSRNNVEQMQAELIRDAYRYYDEAALLGHNDAASKKTALKNNYAFLR